MAKLSRVFQVLFGRDGSGSHFGEFGSRAAGSPVNTKDPATIQALSAFFTNGWVDAINAANKAPFLEDMNGLFYLLFYQIAYLFQEGNAEWDNGTTYFTGSIVKKTGTFELYGSVVDNNLGNALPAQTTNGFWQYLNPQTVASGIIQDFAGSVVPVGYLLCDGTAYAQIAQPNLFAAIGHGWDTFNGAASPGAGNFRVPDLRSLATIGVGQGTGFSNRTLASIVGEENHVLVVGEMPSHSHGVTDPTHAHTERQGTAGGPINGTPTNSLWDGVSVILGAIATAAASTGISIQNTGGGAGHNNMQPSAAVNKIIKI